MYVSSLWVILALCFAHSGVRIFAFKKATNESSLVRHYHKHLMKAGGTGLIRKGSIHGAVITSSGGFADPSESAEVAEKKLLLISARLRNVKQLANELPFPLTEWAGVFTGPCPLYPNGHKTERGLIWAHYRIFREFAYFDPALLTRLSRLSNDSALVAANQPIHSKNGLYVAYPNGTLFKNNQPFLDEDIIAIFEDDAESTINDTNTTLVEEFSDMKVDLLFLGWCEGRAAKPVPLCTHAYALTRRGARKLVQYLEPCGRALDEQFVILAKNNLIFWRRAYGHSYKAQNEKYKSLYGEKTYGIFHQNKAALGSINGHRRQLR